MKLFEKIKILSSKPQDYQVAYERQMVRNNMLEARVQNLKNEIDRQHTEHVRSLNTLDPTVRGMTRHELGVFRRWLIELSVEIRPVLGCENIRYGIQHLAGGYTPDGLTQLDLYDDRQKAIYDVAVTMNKLQAHMDIDDK